MKKDVIIRNMERLVYSSSNGDMEPIEPMSEWKWNRIYDLACEYQVGPWIAEGLRNYVGSFFLNIPPELHQRFLALDGKKDPENLNKFQLDVDRKESLRKRLSSQSMRVYVEDFIDNIRNIEE